MTGIYGIPDSVPEEPHTESAPVEVAVSTRHPRPDRATVQLRDLAVLELVVNAGPLGISRVDVAAKMGLTMHEAYLALNRVQHTGKIRNTRRDNAHVWIAWNRRPEGE